MERKYLIWSIEQDSWWRPEQRGYTFNRSEAGHYSLEEACDIAAGANIGLHDDEEPMEAIVPL